MTISINKQLSKMIFYPEYGVYIDSGSETTDINFTFSSLNSFDGSSASANFKVEIGGVVSAEMYRFSFQVADGENPSDVAEDKLKDFLS